MSEKRFTIDVEETTQENALFENGKFVCFEDDTDEYLKKINEMSDENEKLKQDKTNLHRAMSRDRVKYNQFKDKVFCCIDRKIKLLKDCYMTNEAKILEDLKEEIVMMWYD